MTDQMQNSEYVKQINKRNRLNLQKQISIDYSKIRNLPELITILRRNNIPENQFWIHVSAYQDRKAREIGLPRSGLFELTPLCNLDCKMCYVHLNRNQLQGKELLSVDQWKKIMLDAHALGMTNVTLSGGECLTYPGFDEIYMFLRGMGIQPNIKTNGILLHDKRISFFKKYKPRSINVSLYGSSNEAYENVTGYRVFDTVYDNLQKLKNIEFPVSLSITPSMYMFDDMPEMLKLVRQLGFTSSFNIALFEPRGETGREIQDLSPEQYAEIYKMVSPEEASKMSSIEDDDLPECGISGDPSFGIRCGAGRSSFNVSWNGNLTSCDNLRSLRVNLLKKSFSEAWNLVHEDAISYPLPIECTNCAYDKVCFSCAAFRGNGAEKGHCNPAICKRTRLFVKEGIYKL